MASEGFGLVRVAAFVLNLSLKKINPHKICVGFEIKYIRTNINIKFTEGTNV